MNSALKCLPVIFAAFFVTVIPTKGNAEPSESSKQHLAALLTDAEATGLAAKTINRLRTDKYALAALIICQQLSDDPTQVQACIIRDVIDRK